MDRPHWSFTWLVRIQRTGRDRPIPPGATAGDQRWAAASRLFPWVVLLLLLLEVGLLVWLGVLPR